MSDVPVVLVHGYLATPSTMLPLKWRLQRAGLTRVFDTPLTPLCLGDVRGLAGQLAERVEQLCAAEGVDKLDLVGVSQGGLMALWYLKHLGGYRRVRRLVALGCPFHGTGFASLGRWLGLGLVSRGLYQVMPGSEFLQALHAGAMPPGPELTSVAIPGDWVAPPGSCRLEGAQFRLAPPTRSPLPHQALIVSGGCARVTAEVLRAGPRALNS